jgi:hypothetical protein
MVNNRAMADNLLWFIHSSYSGSLESFKRSKNLFASIFGSSSTFKRSTCSK